MKIYDVSLDIYSLWRKALTPLGLEAQKQTAFITKILKQNKCKRVIDLGGGIGVHAGALSNKGYSVTLLDSSSPALAYAKRNYPLLRTIQNSFESIDLSENFDASLSMWTTFPYIINKNGRLTFFNWIKNHTNKVVILDQSNFYLYPNKFKQISYASDVLRKIKITREGTIDKNFLRKAFYHNEITDKKTGKKTILKDKEILQFLPVASIKNYLGTKWKLWGLYGDYSFTKYDKKESPRLITVFIRN